MEDLHRKLDQLLARSSAGTCPMCGTCTQHSGQLSAQAKLLEALEKNVAELRAAVDELALGLEERAGDKMLVPSGALQRRKSLPVRTSGEEVYVHLDRLRDHKLIHGKAVLLEDAEGEGSRGDAQPPTDKKATQEPSPSVPGSAEEGSGHKPPNRVKMEQAEPTGNLKGTGGAGVELSTNAGLAGLKTQPEMVPQEKAEKVASTSEKINKVTAPPPEKARSPPGKVTISAVKTEKNEVTPSPKKAMPPSKDAPTLTPPKHPPSPTQNQATAKITDVPAPVKATLFPALKTPPSGQKKSPSSLPTFPSPPSNPPKFHVTKFTAPPAVHLQKNASAGAASPSAPPGRETQQPNHVAPHLKVPGPPQNLGKPAPNPQAKSSLSPPRPSAAASFLKQVYSCPDSLSSLQESPQTATAPPGEIQIEISPAPEQRPSRTKTSPKTCFKIIDDDPPQPAPFPHRCVSLKPNPSYDYSIHTRDILGGGRFGKVHRCTDNKSSLRLAAKIISARSAKEKEAALNEIEVMNQLNHANILQLYDAFESKNQVVLIMECVEGGELFERIVDEGSPLTEVDAMVFVKQLCEGVQYMHHMYVLHLDLKPENILCVNRSSHQVKIIDFGLARRYKPREKLRVSFGTPEFLAPEVVNFDFVSFPTDMWTLGVVTYMLLSGLSPFLGDDDSETLNNVLTVNWYFDEETFEHVSAEARDFVSNLLIKERSGRLSAAQCLKHPWLNNISEKAKCSNIVLKSQILLKKYMARRMWKKNYIAIAAANRFKKISSSGSLTSLGV